MNLYFFNIHSIFPQNWKDLVTPLRQKRAEKFLQNDDRLRCLGAGILLAQKLGISSDEEIIYGPWGKPSLRDGRAHFNLSHSGNLVVLAVSEMPVGVDIEQICPIPFEQKDIKQFLTSAEVAWLKEKEHAEDFYRLWTGKEALIKGTGCGLSRTPTSFCVLPIKDGPHILDGEIWNMMWQTMNGYMICTAEHKDASYSNICV